MAATLHIIEGWLKRAKKIGATHVIIVCDTYDHDDYPVEVMPGESVVRKYQEYAGKSMQRVMEVYSLVSPVPVAQQLTESRAWHFEPEADPR